MKLSSGRRIVDDRLDLDSFLPYRINRLAERMSQSLSDVYARRFQLTVPQWRILATLADNPGLSATVVAQRSNLDKVQVSRAVGSLEARGLLERSRSRADGRARELRLSTAGQRLFRSIVPLALAWERQFLQALSPADRKGLSRILAGLENSVANIENPAMDDTSPS